VNLTLRGRAPEPKKCKFLPVLTAHKKDKILERKEVEVAIELDSEFAHYGYQQTVDPRMIKKNFVIA